MLLEELLMNYIFLYSVGIMICMGYSPKGRDVINAD
jgi:hypothetical protein